MGRIIYIMGVSGSGKTTVGMLVAEKTGIPFFDADDFHSSVNKEKMTAGQPLTDDDRKDWLTDLNKMAVIQASGAGAIIACSALKEKYRNILTEGIEKPIWIFLKGNFTQIYERLKNRKGHYMAADLLASQFEILEVPFDAYTISIDKTPEEIAELICKDFDLR